MKFMAEEKKTIDKLLEESDEEQRKNGNKYYTEEILGLILEKNKTEL